MKILMVCLGNICRSPLAEGILKKKVRDNGLSWTVDSAGTGSWHIGELPDPRSRQVARKYGLDISDQRARQLQPDDLHQFDYVFAMDASNLKDIRQMASRNGGATARIELIMDRLQPGAGAEVPDPYWDDHGFERVYQMLDQVTDLILEDLLAEAE